MNLKSETIEFLVAMLNEHRPSFDQWRKTRNNLIPVRLGQETKRELEAIWDDSEIGLDEKIKLSFVVHLKAIFDDDQTYLLLDQILAYVSETLKGKPKVLLQANKFSLVAGERWWLMYNERVLGNEPFDGMDYVAPQRLVVLEKLEEGRDIVELEDLNGRFVGLQKLRIGLCTLPADIVTKFCLTRVLHNKKKPADGFVADQESMKLIAELEKSMDWAIENQVQVLCFPELSIGPEGRSFLLEYAESKGKSSPILIIPGSFHDKVNPTSFANHAPVLLAGRQSRKIGGYNKLERLRANKPSAAAMNAYGLGAHNPQIGRIEEDTLGDLNVCIVATPIGWVGVVICKDFLLLDEPKMKIYKGCVDHLIVVSLNDSPKAGFKSKAEDLRRLQNIATYYVNFGMVFKPDPGLEMAFGVLPLVDGKSLVELDGTGNLLIEIDSAGQALYSSMLWR